jgi:hypothetical protein
VVTESVRAVVFIGCVGVVLHAVKAHKQNNQKNLEQDIDVMIFPKTDLYPIVD